MKVAVGVITMTDRLHDYILGGIRAGTREQVQ